MSSSTPTPTYLTKEPTLSILIGAPFTGKTYTIKSLLHQYQQLQPFKFGKCWYLPSVEHDEYNYLSADTADNNFSNEKLQAYVKEMRTNVSDGRKNDPNFQLEPNFIVLDGVSIESYDAQFRSWLSTFKHTNTWVFFASRSLTNLMFKEIANHAFLFKSDNDMSLCKMFGNKLSGKTQGLRYDMYMELQDKCNEQQCVLFTADECPCRTWQSPWEAPKVPDDFKLQF